MEEYQSRLSRSRRSSTPTAQKSKKIVKVEKKLKSDSRFLVRNIHKVYLIVAVLLGLVLSIAMPPFSEPDGQVHFVSAAKIVNVIPDMSQIAETGKGGGINFQRAGFQDGSHFKRYYESKVQLIKADQLPVNYGLSLTSYSFWGRLVPAVGLWIGYHVYPSIGVMVIFGRLISMLVFSVLMYFIIKSLKRYKLLFTSLMLCPVVLNQFSSFSYDALSFVLAAAVVASVINIFSERKFTRLSIIQMILLSIATLLMAKTNFCLLLILYPLLALSIFGRKFKLKKRNVSLLLGVLLVIFLVGVALFSVSDGGISDVAKKIFVTFVNNPTNWIVNQVPHNFISTFVAPYPTFNNMPVWLVGLWAVMLFLAYLAEDEKIHSRLLAWGAIGIFILDLFALYYSFLKFKTNLTNGQGGSNFILGVQGRYTTPYYLLGAFLPLGTTFGMKLERKQRLIVGLIVLATLSAFILLFNTLYGMTYLNS
jgi:uncharacterized membrane protein